MFASRQRPHEKMANTYSHCYYHIVFSTKDRFKFIKPDIEERVWAYIGGVAREHGMVPIQIGGIDDHVHALIGSPPATAPSKIAQILKGGSSHWIHTEFQSMKKFAWQDGFGVFTVCKSHADNVVQYIKGQRQHHQKQTFEDEFRELLRLHEIEYDERYLFG